GNARAQHANTAHHELDFYAGLRRAVQRADHRTVGQAVELGPDAAAAAGARVLRLAGDERKEAVQHVGRCDEQPAERRLRRARRSGELIEERVQVFRYAIIRGEESDVGVEPGGVRV